MILGHIDNFSEELALYPPAIQKGLAYLRATDFSAVPDGKHFIDGDKMFVVLSAYLTSPADNRRAETHERYLDVQYIIDGNEMMGFSPAGSGEVQENLLAEKDIAFYEKVSNEEFIRLSSGMFAVAFPWDIHRPGCMAQEPGNVRKAVLKIAMDTLK